MPTRPGQPSVHNTLTLQETVLLQSHLYWLLSYLKSNSMLGSCYDSCRKALNFWTLYFLQTSHDLWGSETRKVSTAAGTWL